MLNSPPSASRPEVCLKLIDQVSQIVKSSPTLNQFTQQVVDLIRDNFDFYFVSLFLVNAAREMVDFYAGTGEIGQVLRKLGHRFNITSKGMVGTAISENKVIIDDYYSGGGFFVTALPSNMQLQPISPPQFVTEVWRAHPLLPGTQSQIIIPLRTQQGIIGVLDIHSSKKEDFSQQDIPFFLPLTDQIARICADLMAA